VPSSKSTLKEETKLLEKRKKLAGGKLQSRKNEDTLRGEDHQGGPGVRKKKSRKTEIPAGASNCASRRGFEKKKRLTGMERSERRRAKDRKERKLRKIQNWKEGTRTNRRKAAKGTLGKQQEKCTEKTGERTLKRGRGNLGRDSRQKS